MDEIEKALAYACECAGRKLHHYALMGDELPLRWSIEAHADTIMQYEALQAERDALAAENARLRERLTQAIERLRDMLKGDDGQAWDEAERFVDIVAQETQP